MFYIVTFFPRSIYDQFWKKGPLSKVDFEIRAPSVIPGNAVVPVIK